MCQFPDIGEFEIRHHLHSTLYMVSMVLLACLNRVATRIKFCKPQLHAHRLQLFARMHEIPPICAKFGVFGILLKISAIFYKCWENYRNESKQNRKSFLREKIESFFEISQELQGYVIRHCY